MYEEYFFAFFSMGFYGVAAPLLGADQTVAGLFRRAPQRIVLRAADRKKSGPG